VVKGIDYFTGHIYENIIVPVHLHTESLAYKTKVKKYLAFLTDFQKSVWAQMDKLYRASFLGNEIYKGKIKYHRQILPKSDSAANRKKPKKGATFQDTLALFKQGKTLAQIAEIRSLAPGTIDSHLAKLIGQKAIKISELMADDRIEKLSFYMLKNTEISMTDLKAKIPFDVEYGELRMVREHLNSLKLDQ
jgi:uncharacterized protein YpbB